MLQQCNLIEHWLPLIALLFALGPSRPAVAGLRVEHLGSPSSRGSEDEFVAIGVDDGQRLWLAWVSYDGRRDRLVAARHNSQGWTDPQVLAESAGDYWSPAFGRDGDGRLWLVWAQNDAGTNWNLWARFLRRGQWSEPLQLTAEPGTDMRPALAMDSHGQLWLTWQAVRGKQYEVLLALVTPDGLRDIYNVSDHSADDWEPAIAADADGRLYVAWDSYRSGSFDVLVRSVSAGQLGPITVVAGTTRYEAHAAVAVDRQNRLWIAWDEAGPNWGKHGRSRQRLHAHRSLGLCCLAGGQIYGPAQSLEAVLKRKFARFAELPELAVDPAGRLCLVFRHLEDLTPPGRRPNGRPYQSRGIWNPYVTFYSHGRWAEPVKLPASNGRNDMRVSLCPFQDGLAVAWSEDGRKPTRAEEPVNHNVHAALLSWDEPGPVQLELEQAGKAAELLASKQGLQQPAGTARYSVQAAGQRLQLIYGDTHRHTDISRCAMNYDGSLIDTYRYAIDAAELDFLAISDHDQDLLKHRYNRKWGPLQDYAWWRSQKYCDLFYIPGRFVTLYGYEHGGSMKRRGGHKNVIYAERGMPCYEQDAPEELFRVLAGKDVVVIPHQLADGPSATDWRKWRAEFERVAEIFQARGCYEFFGAPPAVRVTRKGHYLWDALQSGVDIGVIASSDHGLVHRAYAGVYVSEFSRHGILAGLRKRRSFGATDKIAIDLRLGEELLGAKVRVAGPPSFRISVHGTAEIEQLQVVKNNKFVYSAAPAARDLTVQFTDTELGPGESAYYYVRCRQANNEWAWSSAIWVKRQ